MRFFNMFFFLAVCSVRLVSAQACYLQQDCGPGMLCSGNGTCQPIRSLLNTGSNDVYWVDGSNGNDSNNGSENQPFKTIRRAMRSGTLKAGDAVVIRKGVYYEPIVPETSGASGKLITITAYPGEQVVVSGAMAVNGAWTQDGNTWKLAWPFGPLWHKYEGNTDPFGPARRRDVLIADGQMLQAVYARSELVEGSFFLEGSPDHPETMYTILPGNKNPNQALMQTSRTNHLFNPSNNEPNCRFGQVKGYFRVIGLTFRHTANDAQMGAVCAGNEGSILENITVEWTNGSGFLISGKNHIVRGVRALHNGMSGIRGEYCDHCTVEFSASKYNNWKGYTPMWESGGGKWLFTTRSIFRKLDFSNNEGPGLWLDTENFDNIVEQSRFDDNLAANLFLEWAADRNVIRNNVFTRARFHVGVQGGLHGHGVMIHAANNNIILHNTFMGNAAGGIRIRADFRDRATGNRYFNNLFIANHRIKAGANRTSREISFEDHRSVADALTNKGGGNVFWYRKSATPEYATFYFRAQGGEGGVLYSSVLSDWQNKTATDHNSSMALLSAPHVVDTTDYAEGWRLAAESQIAGRGVALPADIAPLLVDFDGEPRPARNADPGADQFSQDHGFAKAGDASGNGIITALDASLILQHTSGLVNLGDLAQADASGDGVISAYDASLILQYVTGFISCLPADLTCPSNKRL